MTEYVVNLNGTPIEDFTIFNWGGCRAPITISECYFFKSADPLATQKSELSAAIARGKMYNALAYTDATFGTLTTKIADGETALAAEGATAESLTGATTGINEVNANTRQSNGKTYNVLGQQVSAGAKGLLIRDGKKITDIKQILPELEATEREVSEILKQQNNNQEIPTI